MENSEELKVLNEIIRGRRSIYPKMYSNKNIADEIIVEMLENANWAPTHKKTEPWRFKVVKGNKKRDLGRFLADNYKKQSSADKFSESKFEKKMIKTDQCSAMIVICMQRDPKEQIEEWEEIAAVSMAVQNILLTCHAHRIGAYWSSPAAKNNIGELLDLNSGEKCLGFIYMGYLKEPTLTLAKKRKPIADKTEWFD